MQTTGPLARGWWGRKAGGLFNSFPLLLRTWRKCTARRAAQTDGWRGERVQTQTPLGGGGSDGSGAATDCVLTFTLSVAPRGTEVSHFTWVDSVSLPLLFGSSNALRNPGTWKYTFSCASYKNTEVALFASKFFIDLLLTYEWGRD